MRKFSLTLILMLIVASITSCKKTEYITITAPTEEPDNSSYTIMLYGCGGGNLDGSLITNIQEALIAGNTERVHFTGQVKYSARFQDTEEFHGTQRFVVGDAGARWYEPVEVLDKMLKLYDPQSLADFITWSKEQCPADNYILILWNHGSAWLPSQDNFADSRAVIHDDVNNSRALTLNELVEGINLSGTKLKMVYYDACLMGMLEIVTGLMDCADYVMCASHVTPGIGGDYYSLMHHLNNSTNFETAMKAFCHDTITHWQPTNYPLDITLVDLSQMDPLLSEINLFAIYLREMAQIYAMTKSQIDNGMINPDEYSNAVNIYKTYEAAINSCYLYDADADVDGSLYYPFFDIQQLAESFANGHYSTYSAQLIDVSSRLNRAFNNAIVCKNVTAPLYGQTLTMGVTIVDKKIWQSQNYQAAYDKLLFQKKTGWGNWLLMNPVTPKDNPNPLSFVEVTEEEEPTKPSFEEELALLLEMIGKR